MARMSGTPEYVAWTGMKARCYNPHRESYCHYGGRGITVCDRWRDDFRAFLADMGPRPDADHSLDRIDPNGQYEPSNCRWANRSQQVRGRRMGLYATVNGERLHLMEWAARLGIAYVTLYRRMTRMTPEQAIRLPFNQYLGGKKPVHVVPDGEQV